jgi:hypothetical protein
MIICYTVRTITHVMKSWKMSIQSKGGLMISRGNRKNSAKDQCHFVHHKSLKSPGIEPGSSQREVSVYPPETWHGSDIITN